VAEPLAPTVVAIDVTKPVPTVDAVAVALAAPPGKPVRKNDVAVAVALAELDPAVPSVAVAVAVAAPGIPS
jgi:hypothetical protein